MIISNSCQSTTIRDRTDNIDQTQDIVDESQDIDEVFTDLNIRPINVFEREVLRRFRVYLSQIDVRLSLRECWADFQQIYPELPDGKARWSRILCAVIITLRVRSQSPQPIPLRTLLQVWDVKRSDYFHVIKKMEQVPLLRDWITNRTAPHRPTFINVVQIMAQIAQTLAIDPRIVDCALDMIQEQCFTNRSEIQVLAALVAACELYPEISTVPANDICNTYPHVAKAHVITLKRRFLITATAKPLPIMTEISPSSFSPKISANYGVSQKSSQDVAVPFNDISLLPHWRFMCLSQTFRAFLFAQNGHQNMQSPVNSPTSGKEINIQQRMFPPTLHSDE